MKSKEYFLEIFSKNEKQDPIIDAIRALSVLSIIVFHVVVGVAHIYDAQKTAEYVLSMPTLLQPLWHGEKGVDAFFLISALVLGLPIFKKIEKFDIQATVEFYKKRFFRIYPLFFFALILYTAGQWSYFGKYFFSNALLINNLIAGERTIIPVGWSLIVEVQYYLLLPIGFFLLKKSSKRGFLLGSVFFVSIGSCVLRLLQNEHLYKRPITDLFMAQDKDFFALQMGALFYEANLTRFGPFIVGLIVAYLKIFFDQELKEKLSNLKMSWSVFLLSIVCILAPVVIPIYDPKSWFYTKFSPVLNLVVLSTSRQVFALGLGLLILGCWYGTGIFKHVRKVFLISFWRPFSRMSFPIYLFHFPFIAVAAATIFKTTNIKDVHYVSFFNGSLIFLIATIFTIIFSIPLYVFIERPFIELIKRNKN